MWVVKGIEGLSKERKERYEIWPKSEFSDSEQILAYKAVEDQLRRVKRSQLPPNRPLGKQDIVVLIAPCGIEQEFKIDEIMKVEQIIERLESLPASKELGADREHATAV